jgi:hypothetical protein
MLEKLNRRLRRIRHKLLRWGSAMEIAERRVKHHRRQRDHFAALAKDNPGSDSALRAARKRDRAADYLHKWQKRQTWIRNKIIYLQLVGNKAARAKHKWLQEHPEEFPEAPAGHEWVIFDGKEVPKWMATINQEARDAGYWNGYVFSGRRDPAYSESLCLNMCGAPTCPGRCGGRYSNHSGPPTDRGVEYEGAEDVSDPAGLDRFCREHNKPLIGNGRVLPADTPHFSHEGN